jgi:hypothetical protein
MQLDTSFGSMLSKNPDFRLVARWAAVPAE